MDLNGKVALVTGSAQGIGLATVKELLKNGVKGVTMCDVDSKKGEDEVQALNKVYGKGRAIFIKTDVTKQKDLEEAFKKTKDTFGTIDIVMNNAGLLNDNIWEKEVDINCNGVVRGTNLALEYMGKHKGGKGGTIVNTASVAGLGLQSASPVYDATKWFVVGYSLSLAFPLLETNHGVRILCMCPGLTDTTIGEGVLVGFEKLNVTRQEFFTNSKMQQPEFVAEAMIQILREAPTGTVWVSDNLQPVYQVKFQDLVAKKSPLIS